MPDVATTDQGAGFLQFLRSTHTESVGAVPLSFRDSQLRHNRLEDTVEVAAIDSSEQRLATVNAVADERPEGVGRADGLSCDGAKATEAEAAKNAPGVKILPRGKLRDQKRFASNRSYPQQGLLQLRGEGIQSIRVVSTNQLERFGRDSKRE